MRAFYFLFKLSFELFLVIFIPESSKILATKELNLRHILIFFLKDQFNENFSSLLFYLMTGGKKTTF